MHNRGELVGKVVIEDPTRRPGERLRYILRDPRHAGDANASVVDQQISTGIHNAQGTKFLGVKVFVEVFLVPDDASLALALRDLVGFTIHLKQVVFGSYVVTPPPLAARAATPRASRTSVQATATG